MTKVATTDDYLNYAKIAGFFYSIIVVLSFIPSQLLDMDVIFSADNALIAMEQHRGTYSIGSAIEFLMFMSVMVLSWALYVLLKPVHKNLATLAFAFRFGEAVLGGMVIVFYIMSMRLLDTNADYLTALAPEQLIALAHFFLKTSTAMYYVILTLMGIGAAIYCYLFYVSNMIPRAFAIWGLVTYLTMIVYGMVNIAYPDAPRELAYAMVPGALFEFLIGLWLFFKGVDMNSTQTAP